MSSFLDKDGNPMGLKPPATKGNSYQAEMEKLGLLLQQKMLAIISRRNPALNDAEVRELQKTYFKSVPIERPPTGAGLPPVLYATLLRCSAKAAAEGNLADAGQYWTLARAISPALGEIAEEARRDATLEQKSFRQRAGRARHALKGKVKTELVRLYEQSSFRSRKEAVRQLRAHAIMLSKEHQAHMSEANLEDTLYRWFTEHDRKSES